MRRCTTSNARCLANGRCPTARRQIALDTYVACCICTPVPSARLSSAAAMVLHAVSNGYAYGFDVMDETGLPSGTVYPALRRLEGLGLVKASWEKHEVAQKDLRPPRRYYELTGTGKEALAEAVKRYRMLGRASSAPRLRPIREAR